MQVEVGILRKKAKN